MDMSYDYIKNIFTIVDFNNEIKKAKTILNNLTSEKILNSSKQKNCNHKFN